MIPKKCFLLLAVTLQVYGESDLPIVQTANGKIQGVLKKELGETYIQFQGVPYAKSPTGDRRFAPPERLTNWTGIWVANTTYTCIQVEHHDPPEEGVTKGDEDCLYLDIYILGEKLNPEANLDVVIHIPGDTFMYGSSSAYVLPKPFTFKTVIIVSINHRVGIFGFLSLEDKILPGNNGMHDQVMALQWIKENIKLFGGNPNSITLTGFGSGAASVHFHMMSPLSEGLFHKAISISGNALDPWAIYEEPRQKTEKVGRAVGCFHEGDSKTFLDCLRSRPPHQLIETTKLFREWIFYPFSPFALVVDSAADKPFLPEHPYKMVKSGKVRDMPWIVAFSTSEGLYPFAQLLKNNYLDHMAKNLKKYLPLALDYYLTVAKNKMDEVTEKIIKEYLGDKPLDRSTFNRLVKMGTDRLFGVGMAKSVRLQNINRKYPVYFINYNYTSEKVWTMPEKFFGIKGKYGVAHGDQMLLLFAPMKASKNDAIIQSALTNITVYFARTGKTYYDNWVSVNGTAKLNSYLSMENPHNIGVKYTEDVVNQPFWDSLPIMENERLVDQEAT